MKVTTIFIGDMLLTNRTNLTYNFKRLADSFDSAQSVHSENL